MSTNATVLRSPGLLCLALATLTLSACGGAPRVHEVYRLSLEDGHRVERTGDPTLSPTQQHLQRMLVQAQALTSRSQAPRIDALAALDPSSLPECAPNRLAGAFGSDALWLAQQGAISGGADL